MNQPNVILINCDDMGYGDLGCYGSRLNQTPTIDALAREGMILTSCYTASSVCSPSRAGMLTGCYPARVNLNAVLFPGESVGLNNNEYTLGNLFKDRGYATKIVGKWHVGDQAEFLPMQYGFDAYYGLPYSNDMGIQTGKNYIEGLPPLPLIMDDEVIEEQPDQRSLTVRYTEHCRSFISDHRDEPFFLYMAHMHMHLPLYAPEAFEKRSDNGDYGACMSEVDWSLKSIIYELKRQGVYDDTIIVFTSDNGSRADHGASNAPLRGMKFTTFEGGQRVPCIIKWHNYIGAGSKNDDLCSQIDFLPTFAGVLGVELPDREIDGVDLSDQLFHGNKVRDTFLYIGGTAIEQNQPIICAVRKNAWKLHLKRRDSGETGYEYITELYNLDEDLSESINVYKEYPEKVTELSEIIVAYECKFGDSMNQVKGSDVRPCGKVDKPKTLTEYDENHPYIVMMYDKDDRG